MNPTHPPDPLDRLLGDFFQGQMPRPWPAAPLPHHVGPPSGRHGDTGRRARATLAASVALLLGTCWVLSGDGPPNAVPVSARPGPAAGAIRLQESTAGHPEAIKKHRHDEATKPTTPDPMKLDDPFGKMP